MPSSRKRNKGKNRKAKQLAKKEENVRSTAHEFWRGFCSCTTECNHGCDMIISDDHPVYSFMDQFIMNLDKGNANFWRQGKQSQRWVHVFIVIKR